MNTKAALTRVLDYCYDRAVGADDAPGGSAALASEYLVEGRGLEECIDTLIRWQIAKCAATGFVTGLGGITTLPVALPADLFANYYIQIRMIAAIAILCGHDVRSDRVRGMVYIALCGNAAADVLKDAGAQVSARAAEAALARLTRGGVAKFGRVVPLLGGLLCGGIDAAACKVIGETAKSIFLTTDRP